MYREILQYSYQDYFDRLVVPYYQARGLASPVADALGRAGDLRTYEAGLRANPEIRVIVNQNDFLLTSGDLAWLRASFSASQLTVYPEGGHLGNLYNAEVQRSIVQALDGLSSFRPKTN